MRTFMLREFRKNVGRQFVALLLCGLFGLGIVGLGERRKLKSNVNENFYERVFPMPEQPHSGQDRGDESDSITVMALSLYGTNTAAQMMTYTAGSLTPMADPYGNRVFWLPV
jgi:hypothetical protein